MRYRAVILFAIFALIASHSSLAEQGDDSAFFQQRSQHAYNSVFGLPVVAPRLTQTIEWHVSIEHSNQFAGGQSGESTLLLDGESTRLELSHRQRLASCWQATIAVPFISYSEGIFDRAIDDWHKFFGLPDANRDATAFDNLSFHFSDATGIKHDINRPQSGIGDVRFAIQRALGCHATADSTNADAMIRVGVKLPTGNASQLRGSGELDVFADWQSPIWTRHRRWHGGIALGVLINGETDRFANQERLAMYGSVGLQFVAHEKVRLIAQIDGHTPFYNSGLRELGDPAVNLAVGARYLAGKGYTFELSISEDAAIDTTPDIVARLAMSFRPDQSR